jgi:hypothetical protein
VLAFAEIAEQLTDREYWRLSGHIWARHRVPKTAVYHYAALWYQIFQSPRADDSHFTRNPADRIKWESMDNLVICYRGYGSANPHGVFYSLNYDKADVYATVRRLRGEGGRVDGHVLYKAECMFFGGCWEEVIHVPSLLLSEQIEPIPDSP